MKNIFSDNKSKARVFGTLLIAILVIAASFTVLFLIPQSPFSMSPASAATGDYSHYKKITIDHTKVASSLTNHPVWYYNVSSDFTNNILINGSDIAFYDSTNTTQYNHEIEKWTKASGELGVHINITSISSSADTILYMYYGDSDTSNSPHHNPESVWDSNFVGVWHLNQTSMPQKDSTSNSNDITWSHNTTLGTASSNTNGCNDFSGSDSVARAPDSASLSCTSGFTYEIWGQCDNLNGADLIIAQSLISKNDGSVSADDNEVQWTFGNTGKIHLLVRGTGGSFIGRYDNTPSATDTGWHYYVGTYDGGVTPASLEVYVDTVATTDTDDSAGTFTAATTSTSNVTIGDTKMGNTTFRPWDGDMDEARISKIERSASYMSTTYNNINDIESFLSVGLQDGGVGSSYELKGLTNSRITFQGTAGNEVFCNSSSTNEWPEINITANATTNITVLRVWIDDLNDTSSYVNASNITMYVSSDNSSYGQLGTFPDGGGNCTNDINSTNWNAGTMGASPFAGAGIIDKTTSIWVIFKLSPDSGTPVDEYWSGAIDSCKVHLGHYS